MLEADGHQIVGIDLRDAEIVADLSTDEGRDHAVTATLERCDGSLGGLVTAAGISSPLPSELILSVNYFGSVALLDGLRPALAAAGQSQVVQIGSNSTTVTPNIPQAIVDALLANDELEARRHLAEVAAPFDSSIAYAATKTAVSRWCRRHAPTEAWVKSGIRLNVLAPGMVQTPLLQAGIDDDTYGPLMEQFPVPTGKAQPDDIAAWIVFMLSPQARFACGSVVFVDGGSDALIRSDDWPASFSL